MMQTSYVSCHMSKCLAGVPPRGLRSSSTFARMGMDGKFVDIQKQSIKKLTRTYLTSRVNVKDRLVVRASWNKDIAFTASSVLKQQEIAKGLHQIVLDVGNSIASGYTKPGQFVQAKVDGSKPGFFAIASCPDPNNGAAIELLVKNQGETAELMCQMNEGSKVDVSDVLGKGFPVEKIPPSEYPIVYIFCTGSGISPIKAVIESGVLEPGKRKLVKVYYGAKSAEFMAYADEIIEWEKQYGVQVVPVFSMDKNGYVQDVFFQDGCEMGPGVAAILCGQKEMAEAVTETLTSSGVSKDVILTNF